MYLWIITIIYFLITRKHIDPLWYPDAEEEYYWHERSEEIIYNFSKQHEFKIFIKLFFILLFIRIFFEHSIYLFFILTIGLYIYFFRLDKTPQNFLFWINILILRFVKQELYFIGKHPLLKFEETWYPLLLEDYDVLKQPFETEIGTIIFKQYISFFKQFLKTINEKLIYFFIKNKYLKVNWKVLFFQFWAYCIVFIYKIYLEFNIYWGRVFLWLVQEYRNFRNQIFEIKIKLIKQYYLWFVFKKIQIREFFITTIFYFFINYIKQQFLIFKENFSEKINTLRIFFFKTNFIKNKDINFVFKIFKFGNFLVNIFFFF
jgi:hypothetical protein